MTNENCDDFAIGTPTDPDSDEDTVSPESDPFKEDLPDDAFEPNPKITKPSSHWTYENGNLGLKKGYYLDKKCTVQKDEILSALDEPDVLKNYLDIGVVKKDNEEFFYYAIKIRGQDAIIRSDTKEVLIDRRVFVKGKVIGENDITNYFEYKGKLGEICPPIPNNAIRRYYLCENGTILVNPKVLYNHIKSLILYFMDFGEQEEIADVLTCWCLATFVYPLFYWFPHLLMNAPTGSGKTKCAKAIKKLSFKGFDLGTSGGVTPPQIFRTMEENRGTMLLDEFELQHGKNEDTQKLVLQVMNAGADSESYIIRIDQIDGKHTPVKFPIFGPKIIANISGLQPVTASRCINCKWGKSISEKSKRKPEKQTEKQKFTSIIEDCYIFGLENWKKIETIYDSINIDSLVARNSDNWLPLFSIARLIDQQQGEDIGVENKLLKYLTDYSDVDDGVDDTLQELFLLIYKNVTDQEKAYQPKEICSWDGIPALFPFAKSPANIVGKKLNNHRFKSTRNQGIKKYYLSKKSVANVLKIYFGTDAEVSFGGVSDVSTEGMEESIEPNNSFKKNDDDNYTNNTESHLEPQTTQNNTNNTNQHKQNITTNTHQTTPNYKEEIISFLKEQFKTTHKEGIPLSVIEKRFQDIERLYPILDQLKQESIIFEPKPDLIWLLNMSAEE